MKSVFFLISAIFLSSLLFLTTPVSAVNNEDSNQANKSEKTVNENATEPNLNSEEINSFDLFWPVVAGKTQGESFYLLKKFKENLRGALIFGDAKAADYNMFLATKRVVEAEKLIKAEKIDLANKTLVDAQKRVAKAQERWNAIEGDVTTTKHEMNNKLDNLNSFLPQLSTITDDTQTVELIMNLNNDIKLLNDSI